MKIKDLIKQLQELEELHKSYGIEYTEVMGEAEVAIDLFCLQYPGSPNYSRQYCGISNEIIIDRQPRDWHCPVITSFAESYEKSYPHLYRDTKGKAYSDRTAAWPESWEAQD